MMRQRFVTLISFIMGVACGAALAMHYSSPTVQLYRSVIVQPYEPPRGL